MRRRDKEVRRREEEEGRRDGSGFFLHSVLRRETSIHGKGDEIGSLMLRKGFAF